MSATTVSTPAFPSLVTGSSQGLGIDATGNVVTTSAAGGGTVLSTTDMTNGGADDLNEIPIAHDVSWDVFDYIDIVVENAVVSSSGQIGWVCSKNSAPSTFLSLTGSTKEAWLPFNSAIDGSNTLNMHIRLNNFANGSKDMNALGASINIIHPFRGGGNGTGNGYVLDYTGSVFTGLVAIDTWIGWSTGSTKWTDHTLFLHHEVGNFTAGTLKVIGRTF